MSKFNQKVCFVIPSFSFGGAERVVTVLASQLACEGYDIAVIKFFETASEYPIDESVKVFCVSCGDESAYKKLSRIEKIKRIRMVLKQFQPDYVVPFLPHVAIQTFIAGLGLRMNQNKG